MILTGWSRSNIIKSTAFSASLAVDMTLLDMVLLFDSISYFLFVGEFHVYDGVVCPPPITPNLLRRVGKLFGIEPKPQKISHFMDIVFSLKEYLPFWEGFSITPSDRDSKLCVTATEAVQETIGKFSAFFSALVSESGDPRKRHIDVDHVKVRKLSI